MLSPQKHNVFESEELNLKNTMNLTEKINKLKREFMYLGAFFIILILIFQIIYHKESIINIIKTISTIFWLFIIPGYCLLMYWLEELNFMERFIIGTTIGMGLLGTLSYFAGLLGVHIKYHSLIFPTIFILIGIFFGLKTFKNRHNK